MVFLGPIDRGEGVDDAEIARVIDTNLLGPIRVVRAALPHLRRQGDGRIVQVSTAGGQTTYPSFGYYHASKWGLEGFSETLAQEVAPFGIGVTIVEPGATPTGFGPGLAQAPPMAEYAGTPAGEVRRALTEGAFPLPNDPDRVAAAMIVSRRDRAGSASASRSALDTYHDVRLVRHAPRRARPLPRGRTRRRGHNPRLTNRTST